jgi:hypothetical protein
MKIETPNSLDQVISVKQQTYAARTRNLIGSMLQFAVGIPGLFDGPFLVCFAMWA